jgi:predicted Zn-dependent protease
MVRVVLLALVVLCLVQAQKAPMPAPGFPQLSKEATQAREGNRLVDAVRLYRQAVHLRPDWAEGWWYLGSLLYDQDHYLEARSALKRFTEIDPKAAPGWALLGLSEYETKQYRPALAHLRRARTLGLEASAELRDVAAYHEALLLTHFEQYEIALNILVDIAVRGAEKPATIEAAGVAALRKPILPGGLPASERELVLQVGRAVLDVGERRAAQAPKDFEDLIARYPKSPELHYLYGAYLLESDPDAGVRELKKELEISPRHVPAMLRIAFEYLKRSDAPEALPFARKAAEIEPQSFMAHAALGRTLVEVGDLAKGIQELELSKQQAPDSPQTRFALAAAYDKAGRAEDAARERAEFLKLRRLTRKPDEP